METKFSSIQKAVKYVVRSFSPWPVSLATVKEVPGLHADFLAEGFLNNPQTPTDLRQKIQEHLSAQRGFSFKNSAGRTVRFVIAPKGEHFVAWVFNHIEYPMPI